jgi:hypothetical protein
MPQLILSWLHTHPLVGILPMGKTMGFKIKMEKETRNKIAGLNEGIQEELDLLTRELQFRVERVTKFKDEILKILDASSINKASYEVKDGQ